MIYTSSVDAGGPSNCSHSPSFLVPSNSLLFNALSQMVVFFGVAILDASLHSFLQIPPQLLSYPMFSHWSLCTCMLVKQSILFFLILSLNFICITYYIWSLCNALSSPCFLWTVNLSVGGRNVTLLSSICHPYLTHHIIHYIHHTIAFSLSLISLVSPI